MQPPGVIRYTQPVNLPAAQAVIADLERHPRRIELFSAEFEAFILWTMDAVYKLAKRGDDDERKMRMVGFEYRARLLLERMKKTGLNLRCAGVGVAWSYLLRERK